MKRCAFNYQEKDRGIQRDEVIGEGGYVESQSRNDKDVNGSHSKLKTNSYMITENGGEVDCKRCITFFNQIPDESLMIRDIGDLLGTT